MTLYGKFCIKFHKKNVKFYFMYFTVFLIVCTHWTCGETHYFEVGVLYAT
jgi:hypothetical protein